MEGKNTEVHDAENQCLPRAKSMYHQEVVVMLVERSWKAKSVNCSTVADISCLTKFLYCKVKVATTSCRGSKTFSLPQIKCSFFSKHSHFLLCPIP